MRKAVLAVLALVLALPATASAARVKAKLTIPDPDFPEDVETRIRFVAAPGESNRLTISRGRSGDLRFRDRANRVHARGDCKQVNRHTARCPTGETRAVVRLRNRPDRVSDRSGDGLKIRGGRGGDRLSLRPSADVSDASSLYGGPGADVLTGGPGDDRITGGPGSDTVSGGGGQDTLIDGETDGRAAPDSYDGGPNPTPFNYNGGDSLIYGKRRKGLQIDLASGQTSMEDTITGVEDLVGGRGDDVLAGDDGDNTFEGGAGDDTLSGRGGADSVDGGDGDDQVSGGDGDDNLSGGAGRDTLDAGLGDDFLGSNERPLEDPNPPSETEPDTLGCGDGDDVAVSDERDTLTACETVHATGLRAHAVPALANADRADFTVDCAPGLSPRCEGRLSLTSPSGQDFGSARYSLPWQAMDENISVPLTPAGRAAVAAGTVVVVKATPAKQPLGQDDPVGGYRIFLKR